MSKQKAIKKRLCWNCEGSVELSAEICPYCGVSVVPASLDQGHTTSFTPPYQLSAEQENAPPPSPYSPNYHGESIGEEKEESKQSEIPYTFKDEFQRVVWAVVLLLSGSVFFLFGLALALFSQNGIFTLQWDGTIWFIYSGISLPLLIFGWRSLMKLDSE